MRMYHRRISLRNKIESREFEASFSAVWKGANATVLLHDIFYGLYLRATFAHVIHATYEAPLPLSVMEIQRKN